MTSFHFLFIYGRAEKPFKQHLGHWTIKLSTESNTNKNLVGGYAALMAG